jgi:hypothetical protein
MLPLEPDYLEGKYKSKAKFSLCINTTPYGGIIRKLDQKYMESFEIWCWRRMEKINWTVGVNI